MIESDSPICKLPVWERAERRVSRWLYATIAVMVSSWICCILGVWVSWKFVLVAALLAMAWLFIYPGLLRAERDIKRMIDHPNSW